MKYEGILWSQSAISDNILLSCQALTSSNTHQRVILLEDPHLILALVGDVMESVTGIEVE